MFNQKEQLNLQLSLVSRFLVSWFHPNRGRDRDRDRDRLFNHEHTGWHCSGFYPQIYTDYADFFGHRSGFFGTPGGIPDFHEGSVLGFLGFWFQGFRVSGFKVSRFHPNRGRGRDRYRDRDRLFHHGTLSWVSGF